MKTLPAALATHVALGTTTLAQTLKITRLDGVVFAFTSADADVTISGVAYLSTPGLDVSSVEVSAGLAVDNLELTTLDDGTTFTKADVLGGVWRNAAFVISRYNFITPADGVETLMAGTVGEVQLKRGSIVAELRGLQQYLQQTVGNVSSKTCRARLGDSLCNVNLAYTHSFYAPLTVDMNDTIAPTATLAYTSNGNTPTYSTNGMTLAAHVGNHDTRVYSGSKLALDASPLVGVQVTAFCTYSETEPASVPSTDNRRFFTYNSGPLEVGFGRIIPSALPRTPYIICWASGIGVASSANIPWNDYAHFKLVWGADNASLTWYAGTGPESEIVWTALHSTTANSSVRFSGTLVARVLPAGSPSTSAVATIKNVRLHTGTASNSSGPVNLTVTGSITSVTNNQIFTDSTKAQAADWFAEGVLTFTSGNCAGLQQKVKAFSAGQFTLSRPMLQNILAGDTYSVYAGCRKRLAEDCVAKFNNVLNFQGEPHLPGIDQITKPI